MSKSKKFIALIITICMIISSVSVCGLTAFAETATEPAFNVDTCERVQLTSSANGSITGETLKYTENVTDIFNGTLKNGAPDFYISANVKTNGYSYARFTYRTTSNGYFEISKTNYASPGTGLSAQIRHDNIVNGIRVTMHVTQSHLQVWVEGEKVVDNDITDTTTLNSNSSRFGFSWINRNGYDVEISDYVVWQIKEPTFNSEKDTSYKIENYGNGTYANGVLTVPEGSSSLFETSLKSNASYYMSLDIKTSSAVNVGYRAGDGYIQLQSAGYQSVGTGGSWTDKSLSSINTTGVHVTVYSTSDAVKIWVDGEKIVDANLINEIIDKDACPAITWTFSAEAKVSNISIWTNGKSDEPIYNENLDVLADIISYGNGTYENGVLTVPSGNSSIFTTSLTDNSTYTMSCDVKLTGTSGTPYVNIGYRQENGYIQLQSAGYQSVGTGGSWTNKSLSSIKTTGVHVTVYSTSDAVKIWVDGEKIVDANLIDTVKNKKALPSITWNNDGAIVDNIMIWQPVSVVGEKYVLDRDSFYKSLVGTSTTIPTGSFNAESDTYFSRNLALDADYYTSFTLKNTTSGCAVSLAYRDGQYIQFQYGGYTVPGTGDSDWKHPFALGTGIDVKIHSTPRHVTIWVNGEILVDNDYTDTETVFGAAPRIAYVSAGEAEVSNIKVWTVGTLRDLDEDGEATTQDMIILIEYLLDLEDIQAENADLNADGITNIIDLIKFKKYFAEIAN